MRFDFATLSGAQRVKLLSSTIVPRPIAWVVTKNENDSLNCAPFSFFNMFSGDPPVLCLGIGGRAGGPKDTTRNIERTGELVVNLVSEDLAEAMNITSIEFPPGVDETVEAALETLPSSHIAPPRIAKSPVAFECLRKTILPIGEARSIVVAEVIAAFVRDDLVLDRGRLTIDTPALRLIARMHGPGNYARTSDRFALPSLDNTSRPR